MAQKRLSILGTQARFPLRETGLCFVVNGITVNKTIQTVESAAAGSTFLIEDVYPAIDGGRFALKRIAGERIEVWADIYRDGDAVICAALIWRREQDREWQREPMFHHGNDRWFGSLIPPEPGQYVYAIEAWTDEFATWRHGLELRRQSGVDLSLDAIEGAGLLTKAHGARPEAAAIIVRQCENFLRPQQGAFRQLVPDDAAQPGQGGGPAWHVAGLHRTRARYCGDGL